MKKLPLHLLATLGLLLAGLSPAVAQQTARPPADAASLLQAVVAMRDAHGDGATAGLWLGNADGEPWLELHADEIRPTASAIKTFYLVELFDIYAGRLDEPLPAADEVLDDSSHPALSHFTAEVQQEIRHALRGASIRHIGEVMMGQVDVPNATYNAAANLVTAALGGPEALTKRIHARDSAFHTVAVRRYMLRDRQETGDNEASTTALATLYRNLASGRVGGLDPETMEAVRSASVLEDTLAGWRRFGKDGSLHTDPLAEIRAGWVENGSERIVYVVMTTQPEPGPDGRSASGTRLSRLADALRDKLLEAGRERFGTR